MFLKKVIKQKLPEPKAINHVFDIASDRSNTFYAEKLFKSDHSKNDTARCSSCQEFQKENFELEICLPRKMRG